MSNNVNPDAMLVINNISELSLFPYIKSFTLGADLKCDPFGTDDSRFVPPKYLPAVKISNIEYVGKYYLILSITLI